MALNSVSDKYRVEVSEKFVFHPRAGTGTRSTLRVPVPPPSASHAHTVSFFPKELFLFFSSTKMSVTLAYIC